MKNNILVLGYFGFETNQLDGQTIKTRNVYNLLRDKEKQIGNVSFFDTQQFQKSKFLVFKMLLKVIKAKKIIYLPAHGNLKYIFPFLFLICKLLGIKILYIVIGGWLYEYLENKPIHKFFLKNITGVFPENKQLGEKLCEVYDFHNVKILPNFRIHSFIPEINNNHNDFKIVFMARVTRLKGIDRVFKLAEYFEKNSIGKHSIIIDFYGPIEKADGEYFYNTLRKYKCIKYKGTIEPNDLYSTLNQYDILVLPTKYLTEGFPGSILDAYISGLPVIVSNWKYSSEFVEEGVTGFIVSFEKGEKEFSDAVLKLYKDRFLLLQMKQNAYMKSKEYSSEKVWSILRNYLIR